MPRTKSAKKALRKSEKRRIENLRIKEKIKKLKKEIKKLIQENKIEEAKKLLPLFYKALDKAAKKGTVKEGKADREKSKIAKLLSNLSQKKIES
jgi:small subunit ribosomal protein S20